MRKALALALTALLLAGCAAAKPQASNAEKAYLASAPAAHKADFLTGAHSAAALSGADMGEVRDIASGAKDETLLTVGANVCLRLKAGESIAKIGAEFKTSPDPLAYEAAAFSAPINLCPEMFDVVASQAP